MTPNQILSILNDTEVLILGGGRGERLFPLTAERAKPAVPIAGNFRLISLPVSNAFNSGLHHCSIFTQYEDVSLKRSIRNMSARCGRNESISVLSPRLRGKEPQFFLSDGHCLTLYQDVIRRSGARIIVVTMADQLMKMNFLGPILSLIESDTKAVLVYKTVRTAEARRNLGVLEIDPKNKKILGMDEKPESPREISARPGYCNANLAFYVFYADVFFEMLAHMESSHDPDEPLSKTGIPFIIDHGAIGFDIADNAVPGASAQEAQYFEDLGTLDRYFESAMSQCGSNPPFNFYSRGWPIFSSAKDPQSPAKIDGANIQSVLLGPNVILQRDINLADCVISNGQQIGEKSRLKECVLLGGDRSFVGRGCWLYRVVLDKDVVVPDGTNLSPTSPPDDMVRYQDIALTLKDNVPNPVPPILSDAGVLFIPKGYQFKK